MSVGFCLGHVAFPQIVGLTDYGVWVSTSTVLRYNYRLRPGTLAQRALMGEWHRSRWIWNQCVQARKDRRGRLTGKDLTAARGAVAWLAQGAVTPQQQTLRTFAGKGKRNFKRAKKALPSLEYTRNGFSLKDERLRLAGGWLIPVMWSWELPWEPSSARVFQDSLGHWYASFVVRVNDELLAEVGGAVGIDWGVASIATASDPEFDLESPVYALKAAKRLAADQRRIARRKPAQGKPSSRGYKTAKKQAARLHKKVARQRQHTARQWARHVVANNQVIVAPAYTTMTRRQCWSRAKTALPLSQRTFQCAASCGYTDGQDRNAARTILATAGRDPAGSFRADVDAVRHSVLPSGQLLRAS